MKIADAFGNQDKIDELLRSPLGNGNVNSWLDEVYTRCLESMELSSALPLLIKPLTVVLSEHSRQTRQLSREAVAKTTQLLVLAATIATDSARGLGSVFMGAGRASELEIRKSLVSAFRAELPNLRDAFGSARANSEVAAGLAAIGVLFGESFLSDQELEQMLEIATPRGALNLAIVLAGTYRRSDIWLGWAESILLRLFAGAKISEAIKICSMLAWSVLAAEKRVSGERALQLGRLLGNKTLNDYGEIAAIFGPEAELSRLNAAVQLEEEPGVAIRQAATILRLAFDPTAIHVSETFSQNSLRFAIHPNTSLPVRSQRIIEELTPEQIASLRAISSSKAFLVHSNLWALWGVPDSQLALRDFLGFSAQAERVQ